MNNNPLIAKQFNPFVRKSSASPLSSLADTNLNTVQEPQAETTTEAEVNSESESESEAVTDQTNQNQPETPVDAADKAAPTDAPSAPVADVAPSPAADAAPVSGNGAWARTQPAESGTPSPAAPVSAEEAKAPQAPAPQQADNASGNQSRRHRRLN